MAVAVVLLLGAAAGVYLVYGKASRTTPAPAAGKSGQPAASKAGTSAPDLCSMLPRTEADRLAPGATVSQDSRDTDYAIVFHCNWANQRISFGEFWRSREIDVRIEQHKGDGAKTGRAMAQNSYEMDYNQGKYVETAKPTPDKGDKEYVSAVKDVTGVGEGAFAQYTWRRSGSMLWYSYGTARARVNDFTIEVKFQAGQQRKDARILTSESTKSINEANAIREVTGLVGHFAKGVAAWKAQHPDVLAKPQVAATSTPSAQPSATPTAVAAFPAACQLATATATGLVPSPTQRARGTQEGADTQTECRWLNMNVPSGELKKIRSVLITVHQFANRAGSADEVAAKGFYTQRRGTAVNMSGSSFGGISWSEPSDLKDLGDQAFSQYTAYKKGALFNGSSTVTLRKGPMVVQVAFAGAEGPKNEPNNSPKVKILPEQGASAGALTMAKAMLDALTQKPIGG